MAVAVAVAVAAAVAVVVVVVVAVLRKCGCVVLPTWSLTNVLGKPEQALNPKTRSANAKL